MIEEIIYRFILVALSGIFSSFGFLILYFHKRIQKQQSSEKGIYLLDSDSFWCSMLSFSSGISIITVFQVLLQEVSNMFEKNVDLKEYCKIVPSLGFSLLLIAFIIYDRFFIKEPMSEAVENRNSIANKRVYIGFFDLILYGFLNGYVIFFLSKSFKPFSLILAMFLSVYKVPAILNLDLLSFYRNSLSNGFVLIVLINFIIQVLGGISCCFIDDTFMRLPVGVLVFVVFATLIAYETLETNIPLAMKKDKENKKFTQWICIGTVVSMMCYCIKNIRV